jgi:hypothetical protein
MVDPIPDKKEIMTWYPSTYSAYHAVEDKKTLKDKIMDIVRNMFSVGRKFGLPKEQ